MNRLKLSSLQKVGHRIVSMTRKIRIERKDLDFRMRGLELGGQAEVGMVLGEAKVEASEGVWFRGPRMSRPSRVGV